MTGPAEATAPSGSRLGQLRLPVQGVGGPLLSLVALVIVLSIASPYFLEVNNIFNVFQQTSVLAVIALGSTLVILSGGIDLSVGSVAALAGAMAGFLTASANLPMALAMAVALFVGACAGGVCGVLIVYGRVPAFVATLAMLSVARGLTLVVTDGQPMSGFPDWFGQLTTFDLFGVVPAAVLFVVLLYAAGWFYLRYRPGGRELFAVGGNEEVARLSGIDVRRAKLRVYTVAGLLSAVGGLILASRLSSAQPTAGAGLELDVIAAVVIGGTTLRGGVGSVTGTLIGVLIIGVLRNGLNLLNVSSFWQQVIIGAVIALAVLVDNLGRRRGRKAAK